MFSNPRFTRKNSPKFECKFIEIVADEGIRGIKAFINNDYDRPPKTLIQIDMYEGNKKEEITGFVALSPEDALKFAKYINELVSQVFIAGNRVDT